MPKKPTKWGMKAFVLTDAKNGYTYEWLLYTAEFITYNSTILFLGKNSYNAKIYEYPVLLNYHSVGKSMSLTVDEGTITEAVVHSLLQGLEDKGHPPCVHGQFLLGTTSI